MQSQSSPRMLIARSSCCRGLSRITLIIASSISAALFSLQPVQGRSSLSCQTVHQIQIKQTHSQSATDKDVLTS